MDKLIAKNGLTFKLKIGKTSFGDNKQVFILFFFLLIIIIMFCILVSCIINVFIFLFIYFYTGPMLIAVFYNWNGHPV